MLEKFKALFNKIFVFLKNLAKRLKRDPNKEKKKFYESWPWWLRKTIWGGFLTCVLTCVFVVLAFAWYAFIYLDDEFDLSEVDNSLNYTSVVYAIQDGEYVEAETLHTSENRIWADIADIPKNLQNAFVAIEDERFYKHSGVDIKRTLAAVLNFMNLGSSDTFGGSTITQQVIKNLSGDDEQTVARKVQEIRRAWYLEREYKKEQILEVYLNTIYLSQGCYGVQTAAEVYFNKTLDELSLLECACIASITKLPTYYDPIQNPENNLERAKNVINKMVELEFITAEEGEAAKAETLQLHVGESDDTVSSADINSYFVDQVILDVIDALVNEKGYSESYARTLVYGGGIQIYSTMDLEVQSAVDAIYKNTANFPQITSTKNGESPQSAIVVIDNATGAVAGMAGGIGEKTVARGLNRATQSYRQPGSCMKPIGTFAPAIEYKTTIEGVRVAPGMMLMDDAVREDSNGNPWPKNYDNYLKKMMSVQAGVDQSKNTIAVRIVNALGARTAFNFLQNNLGVTTLRSGSGYDENDQAMALGGLTNGISVLEITAAYAAFPNEGTYTKPYTFTKICDQNGRVILENRVQSSTAMEKNTADLINQMLEHACTYGTGTSATRDFGSNHAIAGKTGTTSDDNDRWFVGYTKYYTAGVWFGYDTPSTVYYSGLNPAAVAWRKVMSPIHKNLSYQAFDDPTGLAAYTVCVETGKLAGPNCVEPAAGYFFVESPPTATCDVCGVPGVDPNLPLDPNAPTTDPETPTVQPENPNTTPQDPITDPETPTEDPNKTPEETPSEPEDPVEGANPPAETETPIE
ncbi:MAG: PBP1A family penicillin-binding protein [Clostridia bacterium]|nr:PBP1A family penicillin-binding protein [Clostridia bacterium]